MSVVQNSVVEGTYIYILLSWVNNYVTMSVYIINSIWYVNM